MKIMTALIMKEKYAKRQTEVRNKILKLQIIETEMSKKWYKYYRKFMEWLPDDNVL